MNSESKWIIKIRHLYKSFPSGKTQREIFKDVSLTIKKGEFLALLGASGSGKTSFLNILAGLETYESGDLIVAENDLKKMKESQLCLYRNHYIGYIFQSFALLNQLTVIENVMLPYLSRSFNKEKAYQKAKDLLEELGIEKSLFQEYPYYLSGGEQQRTCIARSLILDPPILLADEPTGNLDEENSLKLQNLLKKIQKNYQLTCILVTHNEKLALIANRILRIYQKKIIE